MNAGKIDWVGAFKKYTGPQAIKDFDDFLDMLPINAGYNALVAAGISLLVGVAAVWFASSETEKVSKLHASLMEVQALQPPIPILNYTPVNATALKALADKVAATYKGVTINTGTGGDATVSAQDTDFFPQFLAAVSYLRQGGKNWKAEIDTMCVGRDCTGAKLSVKLKLTVASVGAPEEKKDEETKTDSKKEDTKKTDTKKSE